jgi:predicted Rossmann fold nucleotide-binding protein DprA/Smf involved in DNA uptake
MLRHLSDVLPIEPGQLARRLGLSFAETMTRLGRLELEGRVSRQGAGYVKVHRRGTSRSMSE